MHNYFYNRQQSGKIRRPWMAPPVPTGILDRPEIMEPLLQHALQRSSAPIAVTGVHGTGGFGKTTLAAWLCHEQLVRSHFSGGLLWVRLGESIAGADLASRVNDLIEHMTGSRPTLSDPLQAGFRLGDELDAAVGPILMVVDDVWSESQLEPFLCGGANCRRVVTTRNRWVLPSGAHTVRVDQMTTDQAGQLLTRDLPKVEFTVAGEILEYTGRWPVLLALANRAAVRAVGYGMAPQDAFLHVLERLSNSGPVAFDMDDPERRDRAVAATVQAGLDLIPRSSSDRFMELGIFAEDAAIPTPLLNLYWATTSGAEVDVHRVCGDLADLSLVLEYSIDKAYVRLHDVIRGFLVHARTSSELVELHGKLLDAGAASVPLDVDSRPAWWASIAEMEYLPDHLAEHLMRADRQEDLIHLVTDLRWAEERILCSGPAAIEADLSWVTSAASTSLGRTVRQASHLLGPINPPHSLGSVIASRIECVSELAPILERYLPNLRHPRLVSSWPLPDQPHPALVRTLAGHNGPVKAIAIGPDGTWLATTSDDRTARLWNLKTGSCQHILTGHDGLVRALAVPAVGDWIATGSHDATAKLWDRRNGMCIHSLIGHSGPVDSLVAARDGSWLASGSRDGTIKIWDARTGRCLGTLTSSHGPVDIIIPDPRNDEWLASVYPDGAVRIWDVARLSLMHDSMNPMSNASTQDIVRVSPQLATASGWDIQTWDPLSGRRLNSLRSTSRVRALSADPAGNWLAAASNDNAIRIWDPTTGNKLHTLVGHTDYVDFLLSAPDGRWLASAGRDSTIKVWEPLTGASLHTLVGHSDTVGAVAVTKDGRWLASGGDDRTVRVWDLRSEPSHVTADQHAAPIEALSVAPSGRWVATASEDSTARLWNRLDGSCRTILRGHTAPVRDIAVSPDEQWIATSSDDLTVRLWDAATGDCQLTLTGHSNVAPAIVPGPNSEWLAASSWDATIRIWDTATGTTRMTLTGHTGAVRAIASLKGEILVTISDDGTAKVWDLTSGVTLHTLEARDGFLPIIVPTRLGIVLIEGDSLLSVWDVSTGQRVCGMEAPGEKVVTLSQSARDVVVASGSRDGTARLWNLADGRCLRVLQGHTAAVTSAAFSHDGTWLATASTDRTLTVWHVDSGQAAAAMRVESPLHVCDWLPNSFELFAAGKTGGVHLFDMVLDAPDLDSRPSRQVSRLGKRMPIE